MSMVSQQHRYPSFFMAISYFEQFALHDQKLPLFYKKAGEHYHNQGNYPQAQGWYIKSADKLLEQGDCTGAIDSLNRVFRMCLFLKRMPDVLQRVIPLIEKVKTHISQHDACSPKLFKSIAILTSELSDFAQAATYYELSAEKNADQNELGLAAEELTEAASCYCQDKQNALAVKCHEKAHLLYESLGWKCASALSLEQAGNLCCNEKAAPLFFNGAHRYSELNLHMSAAETFTQAARSYYMLGASSYPLAAQCFKRAALEMMLCGHQYAKRTIGLLTEAGETYKSAGDLSNSADCYREISDYLKLVS